MQDIDRIKSSGKIKVGINLQEGINGAPWAWEDEQTKLILGFEADIARAIAERLSVSEEFVILEGHRSIIGLLKNLCDVSISAHKTSNVMSGIILTNPYYHLTQKIVTLEDSPVYDLVDLKGYKVGVISNSLGEYIIQQENSNLTTPIITQNYNDVLDLFTSLQFKEISAAFIDSPVAIWYAKTYLDNKLKLSEVAYKSGSYSIALREESIDLCDLINQILIEINTREILDKYGLWDEAQEGY